MLRRVFWPCGFGGGDRYDRRVVKGHATTVLSRLVVSGLAFILAAPPAVAATDIDQDTLADFEADMESVRSALGIPGMAAAVVADGQVIWAQGFGYADIENDIETTPHTPFGLASVTKPIAATLIMQLVEEGLIDLDAPVAEYGVTMPDTTGVTVRHLLNHTSEGTPGAIHDYNGNRYGYLGGVMKGATDRSFSELLVERISSPLEMNDTAVNPFDSWSSDGISGLDGFAKVLGRGGVYAHFPDVYSRLAAPYQFGDDYEPVPGMYHLTHSPAAGGLSSVADLARFDIALDAGELLGAVAAEEMFGASVPTVAGRTDLTYALGWYVQDFEGLELVWHTGRWPPSTSALYMKLPELRQTFIVLANTDNLTVPFPGIGNGDLSRSLPALTFMHHFVFPAQHGYALPSIDWAGDEDVLVADLTAVESEAGRTLLERELWSRRQAVGSSGDFKRADELVSVAMTAFPGSRMRLDDDTTAIVGKMPYIAPATSAGALALHTKIVFGWLVTVAASMIAMAFSLWRVREESAWATGMWLVVTLVVGPLALMARYREHHRHGAGEAVICGSLFSVAAYSVGWAAALGLLLRASRDPSPLLLLGSIVSIPVAVDLLAVRLPMLRRAGSEHPVRRGALMEAFSWPLGLIVFFAVTFFVDDRWLSTLPAPTSPYFGAMISVAALLALILLVPLNLLLRRRSYPVWRT